MGGALNATEAAREGSANVEEIKLGDRVIETAPALFECALTWSGTLEGFGRAAIRAMLIETQNRTAGRRKYRSAQVFPS